LVVVLFLRTLRPPRTPPPLPSTPLFRSGAVATTGVASVTVAVQLVGLPTGTEAGVQLTLVAVECLVAVTAAGGLVESACAPSPAYLATMECGPAVVGV